MFFNFDPRIIPSGIHIGDPVKPIAIGLNPPPDLSFDQIKIELCNPMELQPIIYKELEIAPIGIAFDLQKKYKGSKIITTGQLEDFANVLTEIRKTLDVKAYNAVIIPLRGALKPWVQLSVMGQHRDRVILLPFTFASQRGNDERIRYHLCAGIAPLSEEAELRLAVVDTAHGGNGSSTLAELLRDCHGEDTRRHWCVDFHLIHKRGTYPPLSRKIPSFSEHNLHFNPFSWPVESVIMEDWSAAIGLEEVFDDGQKVIVKESSTDGVVILQTPKDVVAVHSPTLHHYMDAQLARAVSEAVVTDPDLKFLRDVWQNFKSK